MDTKNNSMEVMGRILVILGIIVAILTILSIIGVIISGVISGYYLKQVRSQYEPVTKGSDINSSFLGSLLFCIPAVICGGIPAGLLIISGRIIRSRKAKNESIN